MLRQYIAAAMRRGHYEMMDQPNEPYLGTIPEIQGVFASGETLEECRDNLEDTLEKWVFLGIQLGHAIPEIDGIRIEPMKISA